MAELLKRRARGEILPTSSSPRATTTSLGKYEVADDAETADEGKLLTEDDKKKKADDKRRAEAHALEREKVFFGRVPLCVPPDAVPSLAGEKEGGRREAWCKRAVICVRAARRARAA